MCPRTTSMQRPIGMMDFDLFQKIVDEAVKYGTKAFSLHVFGESLLYPKIFEAISYIKNKDKNISITLSTNGTLLNHNKNTQLLESGIDILILSLDGATKETYEQVRVGAKFDEVIQTIKDLLTQKKERNLEKPLISIQIIYMEETKKEIEQFFEIWKPFLSKNVFISVKKFNDFSAQVNILTKTDRSKEFQYMPCNSFWSTAVIHWDGTVTPCCMDLNEKLRLGKVDGQTLLELLNGEIVNKMREDIAAKKYDSVEFCRFCSGKGTLIAQYPKDNPFSKKT